MSTANTAETAHGESSFLERNAALMKWIAVGLIAVALLLFARALPLTRLTELLEDWITGLGVWGPIVFGLIYIVATLSFAPGWILSLTAGAVFGLLLGTIVVSISATTAAALAFLIARYLARGKVAAMVEGRPKLKAVDRAIDEGGWKIVALLRLSPAVPFNLQNYLYGLTAVKFWPCVLASWVAMLPGTFMYVYFGYAARTAATAGSEESGGVWKWVLNGVGLVATIAVTVYITKLAQKALSKQTDVADESSGKGDEKASGVDAADDDATASDADSNESSEASPTAAIAMLAVAVVLLAGSAFALVRQDAVKKYVEGLVGLPPSVEMKETYPETTGGPTVDHSVFDELLKEHVQEGGWVDYKGLQSDSDRLDEYIASLEHVPFDELNRNEKLALLINAYNACTLRLMLDHPDVESIMDIPEPDRWEAKRWKIAGQVWSLGQIEHEVIRPNFIEPRIHFALVCAAVGCPPLRTEAYTADQLEGQLQDQAEYVHNHDRWFEFQESTGSLKRTELYDWYGGDFKQAADTTLEYMARYSKPLEAALEADEKIAVAKIPYNWDLNSVANKPQE